MNALSAVGRNWDFFPGIITKLLGSKINPLPIRGGSAKKLGSGKSGYVNEAHSDRHKEGACSRPDQEVPPYPPSKPPKNIQGVTGLPSGGGKITGKIQGHSQCETTTRENIRFGPGWGN